MADGMPGLALTDHGAMFGIKDFINYIGKAKKGIQKELKELEAQLHCSKPTAEQLETKISRLHQQLRFKPIIGCECYCAVRGRTKKEGEQDRSGYHLIGAQTLQDTRTLSKWYLFPTPGGLLLPPPNR